jgi:NAD(P) transhydrogenase subunit alpha
MRVGVPKETAPGERRVALVPDAVSKLGGQGFQIVVERGAGQEAGFADGDYEEAGATLVDSVWGEAEAIVKVQRPSEAEVERLRDGDVLIGFLQPLTDSEGIERLTARGVLGFAMESIPRITRAQPMDALSSQATVAGYAAVLIAARESGRFFPMLTTAAGTIKPARVLVLGAGVAGLQAIATAKRLGAIVSGFDVRRAAWEQIASLGGRPLELDFLADAEDESGYARPLTDEENARVREEVGAAAAKNDIVITTAQIPGRKAPILIEASAVKEMEEGSVIVDLAGDSGGNCELTEGGQTVKKEGVTIAAPSNLPSDMPGNASQLYAKNVQNLLELMAGEDGSLNLNFEDDIIAGACITHGGEIKHERAKEVAEGTG